MAEPIATADVQPIPADGVLIHIGVFKTGTTALQAAMSKAQPVLAEHGVLFRGPSSWQHESLQKLVQQDARRGPWRALVAEVGTHRGRAMISAEGLCTASDQQARRIVRSLGRDRPVHVLITVRAIGELLPSTWQQFLKRGWSIPFEQWLDSVFDDAGTASDESFWTRNNYPALVARWGSLVGERRVTVVMSEKDHPRRNRAVVERLLALPDKTVRLPRTITINRSMSHAEAELLRRVNESVRGRVGPDEYRQTVRLGVFPGMDKVKSTATMPIPVPETALRRASELGAMQAERLVAGDVVIVGDISRLAQVRPAADPPDGPLTIDIESAAAAVTGSVQGLRRVRRLAQERT